MTRIIAQTRFAPASVRMTRGYAGASATPLTDRRSVTRSEIEQIFAVELGPRPRRN